jgi:hypothetical protein
VLALTPPASFRLTHNCTATRTVRAGTQRTIRSHDFTKYLQISGLYGHIRTHWNYLPRIVALEKVAGSSPVGHPMFCRIDAQPGVFMALRRSAHPCSLAFASIL